MTEHLKTTCTIHYNLLQPLLLQTIKINTYVSVEEPAAAVVVQPQESVVVPGPAAAAEE